MIRERVVVFAIGARLFGAGNPAFRINVPPQQKADQKAGNPQDQDEAANFPTLLRRVCSTGCGRHSNGDQVAQFFNEYEAFQVHYQITQASTEGRVGVAMADFELQPHRAGAARPTSAGTYSCVW